jgi:hypothetical protein
LACPIPSARAAEPPADLCSLLPADQVSKAFGQAFNAPTKSVPPRPYANTAEGKDCANSTKNGSALLFRAYIDPSPSAATELHAKLKVFYSPSQPQVSATRHILTGITPSMFAKARFVTISASEGKHRPRNL